MRQQAERVEAVAAERVPPVLSSPGFLLLWLTQIIGQTAQNAVLFGLIIRVLELTDKATSTSVVVLCFAIPTVAFGVFSGILVDRWSKRRLLILTNAGRAACAVAYFFGRDHVSVLYGVTIVFSSMSQLSTTSIAASVPFMVPRQQLISANSLYSGAFTIAQIGGLIVIAPLILKTAGSGPLFISAATAFITATFLARLLPPIGGSGEGEEQHSALPGREEFRGAISEFLKALRSLRSDTQSTLALAHITVSSTLILLFAVMVPRFMQSILDVPPDNAVAIFAPVAFGALFGLRAVPVIVGRFGKNRTVVLGLFGLAVCVGALGSIETIADLLQRTERLNPFGGGIEQVFGLSILVTLTMLLSGPLGFAYALLNTPAQTTLHERTPVEMRGRVIASQMVLANGVALIPLVVVGGIADLYGVSTVVLAIAVFLALAGALSLYLERRWLEGEDGSTPPHGGEQPEWSGRRRDRVSGSIDTT